MTDRELKKLVEGALESEPKVDTADIGVSVDAGVVTLRGNVGSYLEKVRAERVVSSVYGVKAIANDLVVHLRCALERTDTEIAKAAVAELNCNPEIPDAGISITVENGWIALSGVVAHQHQKDAATRALRDLIGVNGVLNKLVLESDAKASDIKEEIAAAFRQSAEVDARNVAVIAKNGRVTLAGQVHSMAERQQAARIAWRAEGVEKVEDYLSVVSS
jgi:osmotically-inducible protein OsmY